MPRRALILSGAALRSLTLEELGGLDVSVPGDATGGYATARASGAGAIGDLIRDIELLSA